MARILSHIEAFDISNFAQKEIVLHPKQLAREGEREYVPLYMAFCLQPVAPPLSCQIFHEADAVENLRKAALPQRGGGCGRARGGAISTVVRNLQLAGGVLHGVATEGDGATACAADEVFRVVA